MSWTSRQVLGLVEFSPPDGIPGALVLYYIRKRKDRLDSSNIQTVLRFADRVVCALQGGHLRLGAARRSM